MEPAGYSGTPLPAKLGLKDGQAAGFVALPPSLADLPESRAFAFLAQSDTAADLPAGPFDYLHLFTDSDAVLAAALPDLLARLRPDGMIWISWPKKVARIPTDVTENGIRARALATILVDVKVCAVDPVWSGLKLVIRKDARARVLKGAA